jgi:nucleoside-diphosphate-sugar epimerase
MSTILLTGASGAVGSELAAELTAHGHTVVGLTHRAPLPNGIESVPGDVAEPKLRLGEDAFAALAQRIDLVVHCAAETDLASERVAATNVAGTRHVLDLCRAAECPLLHVSTAFVQRREEIDVSSCHGLFDHLKSKADAEEEVRAAEVTSVIARLPLVLGHSTSGEIAKPQIIHRFLEGVLFDRFTMVPVRSDSVLDALPVDLLGRALTGIAEALLADPDAQDGELYWVTNGPSAPTGRECAQTAVEIGRAHRLPAEFPVFEDEPEYRHEDAELGLRQLAPALHSHLPFPTCLHRLPPGGLVFGFEDQQRAFSATVKALVRAADQPEGLPTLAFDDLAEDNHP